MKQLSAKVISQDLGQTLSAEAVTYPTATWYLRVGKFPGEGKVTPDEAGMTPVTQSTQLS
jgi:hypothetical protein